METEQMMAQLLAEIRTGQKHMQEMTDANQAKIKAEMMARLEAKAGVNQEKMKAKMASLISQIENNNEKFEVLRDTLVSWMVPIRKG
jgi:tRNA(Phe) wybutosine-synthesizing methylase Tyw3